MNGEVVKEAWAVLFSIPLGKVVGWAAVILCILSGLSYIVIKLFKVFSKYTELKTENEEQHKRMAAHDELLGELRDGMKDIRAGLKEQKEVNYRQLRYAIIQACDEAIRNGEISAERLQFIEDMFQDYEEIFHGNGYIKLMVEKVRLLPIIGVGNKKNGGDC